MSRFYVRPGAVAGGKIYIEGEESHHIIDVMRLKEGDSITVFDGTGREYDGKIDAVGNKSVVIGVSKTRKPGKKSGAGITLAQAIPKKDKMDLIVREATELGVNEIIPVETSRTIVRIREEKEQGKRDRWRKIAVEASKQSGRTDLPGIGSITPFADILGSVKKYDIAVMPCLSKKSVTIGQALKKAKNAKSALVMIGPEGGFSDGEIKQAVKSGSVPVTLGPLVLKCDTAAVAALSILNHELTEK